MASHIFISEATEKIWIKFGIGRPH